LNGFGLILLSFDLIFTKIQKHKSGSQVEIKEDASESALWRSVFSGRAGCTGHCDENDEENKDNWSKSGKCACPVEVRFWLVERSTSSSSASPSFSSSVFLRYQTKIEKLAVPGGDSSFRRIEHASVDRARKVNGKLK